MQSAMKGVIPISQTSQVKKVLPDGSIVGPNTNIVL